MKYKPTPNYVAIKPIEEKSATKSGIILPPKSKQTPQTGKVLAVGDSLSDEGKMLPLNFKAGDTVLFKKWSAVEILADSTDLKSPKYLFVKHDEVLAVIEEGE